MSFEVKKRKWLFCDLNLVCGECGNVGAGKLTNKGFGGTVPYVCPKCGNEGLSGSGKGAGSLECYTDQFKILFTKEEQANLDKYQKKLNDEYNEEWHIKKVN